MNDKNFNKHISSLDFIAFKQDQLSLSDLKEFLEHIGSCDLCSDLLAQTMETELITAPIDMKTNIKSNSKHLYLSNNKKAKATSKYMELFQYSLKVVTASVAAIIMLFLTYKIPYSPQSNIEIPNNITESNVNNIFFTSELRNSMDQFSNQILEFSNTIIKTEVVENDQKEK